MLSQRFAKWKWFDIIAFFVVVIIVCVVLQKAFPGSGIAQAIHAGAHFIAILLEWLSGGLTALAGLLNQL